MMVSFFYSLVYLIPGRFRTIQEPGNSRLCRLPRTKQRFQEFSGKWSPCYLWVLKCFTWGFALKRGVDDSELVEDRVKFGELHF